MPKVQIPTKIRRNAPCYCGSGRKYKKCCGKTEGETIMNEAKITTPQSLKNEFRDEVRDPYAGIPKDELVTRDQAVLLREISFRKEAIDADHVHFMAAIERAKAVRMALLAMPKSPYREAVLKDLDEQIKVLTEKAEKQRLPVSMNLALLALKELFAETEETEDVDKLVEQVNKRVAESEVEVDNDSTESPELSDDDDDPKEVI